MLRPFSKCQKTHLNRTDGKKLKTQTAQQRSQSANIEGEGPRGCTAAGPEGGDHFVCSFACFYPTLTHPCASGPDSRVHPGANNLRRL